MFKKMVFVALMVSVMAGMSFAARSSDPYTIPEDLYGEIPGDVNLVGAKYNFYVDAVPTANIVSTYPVVLYGVLFGLPPLASGTTSWIIFYDSAPYGTTYTGNGSENTYKIMPTLYHSTSTTNSVLNTIEKPITEYYFNPPIITTRGLVSVAGASNQQYSVIWRYRHQSVDKP